MNLEIANELTCGAKGHWFDCLSDHEGNPMCMRCGHVDHDAYPQEDDREPKEDTTCHDCGGNGLSWDRLRNCPACEGDGYFEK